MQRVWRLAQAERETAGDDDALTRLSHRSVAAITADIDRLQFNKAVARLYEFANALEKAVPSAARTAAIRTFVLLLSPMMPHLAEEAWSLTGAGGLIAEAAWPVADPALLVEDTVTMAVQINGKLKDTVTMAKGLGAADVEAIVLDLDKIRRALDGKPPRKVIVVPDRLVNLVA